MNGVIINDERIHQESWRQLCKKYNLSLTEEEFKQNVFGRTEKDTFQYLLKKEINEDELVERSAERVRIAMDILKPQMVLTDGLKEFLNDLHANNVPVAIATSSRRPYTDLILDGLNIRKYFSFVITAEEVIEGKPNPEIYTKTAEAMKVAPEDCVVFEDSISGIKSGKSAGMKVIALASTHGAGELSLADKVINTFRGLKTDDVRGLY